MLADDVGVMMDHPARFEDRFFRWLGEGLNFFHQGAKRDTTCRGHLRYWGYPGQATERPWVEFQTLYEEICHEND